MKFTEKDIKRITDILFNIYSLAKKKKVSNIPDTFKDFINQNITSGLCPLKCSDYISLYNE